MKVLVLEDESGVAKNLCDILAEIDVEIEVLGVLETVREAIKWINNNPSPDLGFFDIRLADGNSFKVFENVNIHFPIIFTTAYDEYALKAFKVNSIDYLLKPINKGDLIAALDKYKSIYQRPDAFSNEHLLKIIQDLTINDRRKYKKSFLVYIKDKILPLPVEDIAYFHLKNELTYCITHTNKIYRIDYPLDKIVDQISPDDFFRVNRQFLVSRQSIKSAVQHFHRKLKLNLSPVCKEEIFISKIKTKAFKEWLEIGRQR